MAFQIIHPDGRTLTLDHYSGETYTPSGEAPAHPLENGEQTTDDYQRRPLTFTVQGEITHSPFENQAAVSGVLNGLAGKARINAALAFLAECEGERLTAVSDDKGTLKDLLLIAYPHSFDVKQRMTLDLSFKQVRFATVSSIIIAPEVPREEVAHSAPDEQDLGYKSTLAEANDSRKVEQDKRSMAAWVVDSLRGQ